MTRGAWSILLLALCVQDSIAAADSPTVRVEAVSYAFAALSVVDIAASAAWYQEHFGVTPGTTYTSDDRAVRILVLSRPGLTIELQQHAAARTLRPPGGKAFLRHGIFKFGVTVHGLRDAVDRLAAAGTPIVVKPFEDQEGRFLSAIIEDNSGNLVQLFERTPLPVPSRE